MKYSIPIVLLAIIGLFSVLFFGIHDGFQLSKGDTPSDKTTWSPTMNDSYYIQLQGSVDASVDATIYEVDLFDTPKAVIGRLHADDKRVVCYFSAGTHEDWREDAAEFPEEVLGNKLDQWEGERWLDIANYGKFSSIMEDRLDLALKKNCDGVEPDNIDAYINPNGFNLTYDDQLRYTIWLAEQAHKRNLSIALKNNIQQINDLEEHFDFAVNEQCFQYDECDAYTSFIEAGKPVFNIEYELEMESFCGKAEELGIFSMKANYALDGSFIRYCEDI